MFSLLFFHLDQHNLISSWSSSSIFIYLIRRPCSAHSSRHIRVCRGFGRTNRKNNFEEERTHAHTYTHTDTQGVLLLARELVAPVGTSQRDLRSRSKKRSSMASGSETESSRQTTSGVLALSFLKSTIFVC